jgi:hypothetical protein
MTARVQTALIASTLLLLCVARSPLIARQTPGAFAETIAKLSGTGGHFDTDNLISNEGSYLDVIPALEASGASGGAYIGVGPDQNFSYIAEVRPAIAFIVDVRRDNLLLHLLFKSLFTLAPTRVEYVSLLFGVSAPADPKEWRNAGVARLIDHVDRGRSAHGREETVSARIEAALADFGVPLSDEDRSTISRFHRTFVSRGLDLKFETFGRPPQLSYPTYRELLAQADPLGRPRSFLSAEARYEFVRRLQTTDRLIPVVGDLSGPTALPAIGRMMRERGDRISAMYVSNVEFYLFRGDRFDAYIGNLSRVPHDSHSVLIRAIFGGYARRPGGIGYGSASAAQSVAELVDGYTGGRFRSYGELVPR